MFPVPKEPSRSLSNEAGYEITITPFNTIKGDKFDEMSSDLFFKKIEIGVNRCSKYYKNKDYGFYLCYDANVYKIGDNNYKISFLNKSKTKYDEYNINTMEYPNYGIQLDEFVKVTNEHEYERECYKKLEGNKKLDFNEKKGYSNYLSKVRRICNSYILKKLLIFFGGPTSCVLSSIAASHGILLAVGIFTALTVSLMMKASRSFIDTEDYYIDGKKYMGVTGLIESFKQRRILNKRINSVQKKIGSINNYHVENSNIHSENTYKNAVINYMNSIMQAANKLNSQDKNELLYELKMILEEYTNECKKINDNEKQGLFFEGNERQITMNTIDKLTTLEMKVADQLKRDNSKEDYS